MITREEAAEKAIEHLRDNIDTYFSVREVLDIFEHRYALPPVYGAPINDRSWIVYLNNHLAPPQLDGDPNVIFVSKDTGEVLYYKRGNDLSGLIP